MRVESISHALGLLRDALAGLPQDTVSFLVRPHRILELFGAHREEAAETAAYGVYRDLHADAAALGEAGRAGAGLVAATKRALFEAGNLAMCAHQAIALREHPEALKRNLERFGLVWNAYQAELTGLLEERSRSLAQAEEQEAVLGAGR